MKLYSLLTTEFTSAPTIVKPVTKSHTSTFWQFIFSAKNNKHYLGIAVGGTIMQFIIFKMLYPFPDFISDSFSYIDTNLYHMDVNLWPIGYSKFLLFVHMISQSDTFLIAIQYILLQLALGYFFFTINYLYQPCRLTRNILFIFIFFNPLFLYLSNCVLSDALFTALTLVFIGQFLFMLRRPIVSQVIIQGLVIGICFTLRYTAIYYPLVAVVGMFLSNHKLALKLAGSLLGIALMIPFYIYTQKKTKAITGTAQFSVFGGWQLANNALYMYDHIVVDSNQLPKGMLELNRMAAQFYKDVPEKYRDFGPFPGTYFIKVPVAVLKPYMARRYSFEDALGQFRAWGMVSPIYQKYASYLIMHYPFSFARYYLWLNTKNYFLPHLEKYDVYNRGSRTVEAEAQDWFGYQTPNIRASSWTVQGKIFMAYPILFLVMNIYFAGFLIWLAYKRRYRRLSGLFRKTLIVVSAFLVVNCAFSVFATPVVLRYQIVPIILLFSFLLLLLEYANNFKFTNSI